MIIARSAGTRSIRPKTKITLSRRPVNEFVVHATTRTSLHARWILFPRLHNKSLDASGITQPHADNMSVIWLTAAASTQPFGGFLTLLNDSYALATCNRWFLARSRVRYCLFLL